MSAPIREAIVITAPGDGGRAVAGVPLLLRTILSLQRAGIERCTLVGGESPPVDPRIRCALATAPALEPSGDDALRLLVGAGTVIDDVLVHHLQARARPGQVIELERAGASVRVAPGSLVTAPDGHRMPPAAGTLAPAAATAGSLERALLRGLENPRDGYLDRLLYRHLSRPATRLLLRTRLSPNAVTVIGVALGVAGGLLLGAPGTLAAVVGILGLIASGVLDCSDGELARLRFSESRLGHWLDVGGDTLVHLALFGGIALRLERVGAVPGRAVLVLLALGVAGAFVAISASERAEPRRRRVPSWENRILDGVLSPLSTRDWYVFPIAFAFAGQLDRLVPAAAVGAHVFWILVVVLLVRALGKR